MTVPRSRHSSQSSYGSVTFPTLDTDHGITGSFIMDIMKVNDLSGLGIQGDTALTMQLPA